MHKDALKQGLQIFGALALLTVVEYVVAVTFASVAVLTLLAAAKAGLVVYYYMHIYKLLEEQDVDRESYAYKTATNRVGLWLFLVSDLFLFAGLLVARFNLLGFTRPHLNQLLGLAVTVVLLVSSFFMNRAETQLKQGDLKGFRTSALVTLALGIGFLLGVVGVEWPTAAAEGLTASSGAAGAIFYMMTGMHAFHVLTGVVFIAVVYRNAQKGVFADGKDFPVEAAAVYWHFVDVVWIFFYPALYLIGQAL